MPFWSLDRECAGDEGDVAVSGLTVEYDHTVALEDVSFRLELGERVAVVGPNGAGKSTLFKAMAGLLAPTRGTLSFFGTAPQRHLCVAYVPQRSQVDLRYPVNVRDVVMMGRVGRLGPLRWPTQGDRELVRDCLATVNLTALAGRQLSELSGGQQQRVFIARALAQEARILLLDEPFAGLDTQSEGDVLAALDELRRRKVTVLVATHDLNQAAQCYDRVMLLNRRLVGLGMAPDVLTPELLAAAYEGHLRVISGAEGLLALGDTCCGGGHDHPHE